MVTIWEETNGCRVDENAGTPNEMDGGGRIMQEERFRD